MNNEEERKELGVELPDPPECKSCAFYKEVAHPATGVMVGMCWDPEGRGGVDAVTVRAEVDGCGPDGDWYEPAPVTQKPVAAAIAAIQRKGSTSLH